MIDTARSLESAEQQAESFTNATAAAVQKSLNLNDSTSAQRKVSNCWNCGNPRHSKSCCPARNLCHACNQMGHFAKYCKSKNKQNTCSISEETSDNENKTTASVVFSPKLIWLGQEKGSSVVSKVATMQSHHLALVKVLWWAQPKSYTFSKPNHYFFDDK